MKVRASTRQSPMQRMHPSFIISGVLGLDGTVASVLDLSLFVRAVSSDWGLVSANGRRGPESGRFEVDVCEKCKLC